jgi:hypothetical protein
MLNFKKIIVFLITFLFLLILSSCSDQVQTKSSSKEQTDSSTKLKTVSNDEVALLKVDDYFPALITRNQYISPSDDGTNQIILEVAKYAIGLNNETERIIESFNYQDNVELGHSITQYSISETDIKNDKGDIDLTNISHWTSGGMDFYILSTNKSVHVSAGIFESCIEVLRNDPKTKWQSTWTYAPHIGVIQITSKSKGKKEKILAELTSTNTTPYGENNQGGVDSEANGTGTYQDNFDSGYLHEGIYVNKSLNFSLFIPLDWNRIVTVEKGSWTSDADYIIDFFYTPPNTDIKENIFSIIIFEKAISENDWDNQYPLWRYIKSQNDKTFAYVMPGEPGPDLLVQSNSDKLELLQKMIYTDLPTVIQSFKNLEK